MSEKHYTQEHEWIEVNGQIATIGITDHAQEQMGDVVFVELPQTGAVLSRGDEAAVIESVKAASEINAPVSGKVVETNTALEDEPGKVNEDAENTAWFMKIELSDTGELAGLMDAAAYKAFAESA